MNRNYNSKDEMIINDLHAWQRSHDYDHMTIVVGHQRILKQYNNCDTTKGNESLVENVNFFKMLNFDANSITIGYLVTEL